MTKRVGIIADDLTGANDTGAQLIEKGINTSVFFGIPRQKNNVNPGIVIDTNSRALSQKEAISATKEAAIFLQESGCPNIFKKIDSTLRGHIGVELLTIANVFKPEFIIVAPALPFYGRTTRNGIHYVNGIEITNTEVAIDPKHPVTESSIVNIIERETGLHVGLLTKDDLECDIKSFTEKMKIYKANGLSIIVCDAESQEDLQQIVKKINVISTDVIWVGSAGLAEAFSDILVNNPKDTENKLIYSRSKNVMTVCGTLSQVAHDQVKYAINKSGIYGVEVNTIKMFEDNWDENRKKYIKECIHALEKNNDIVLYVPSDKKVRTEIQKLQKKQNLSENQVGERISYYIGEMVNEIVTNNGSLSGLVLTGGDTARDTVKHLGGNGFRLIKQIESGIPLGVLIGTKKEITVVTKAGSFGMQDSIYNAMQELKGVSNND